MKRPFRLSVALPLGQLVLCAVLILIFCGPRSLMPLTRRNSGEVRISVTDRPGDGPVRRVEEPSDRQRWIAGHVLSAVWLLNVPGGFLQMEAAAHASTHQGWMGRAVDGFTTSLLSSAILALPFWWIAGRGADALIAMRRNIIAPRIRFPDAAVAFVLLVGAGLLFLGRSWALLVNGNKPVSLLVPGSLLLWCFLGGIPVRARYKQLRKLAIRR